MSPMPDPLRGTPFALAVEGGATLAGEVYRPAREADPSLPAIVLAHGWEIECVANEPKGACFRLKHLKLVR